MVEAEIPAHQIAITGQGHPGLSGSGGILHRALEDIGQALDHHLGGHPITGEGHQTSQKGQHIEGHAVEGQQLADAELAGNHETAAVPEHGQVGGIAEEAGAGAAEQLQLLGEPAQPGQATEVALHLLPHLGACFAGFQHLGRPERLHQEALVVGRLHDQAAGVLLQRRQESQIHADHHQEGEQGREAEARAVAHHHRQGNQSDEQLTGQPQHEHANQLIHVGHISHAAHHLATAVTVEIGHRQLEQPIAVIQFHPQLKALGEMTH